MFFALFFHFMHSAKLDVFQQPGNNGALVARLNGKLGLETVSTFLQQMRQLEADKVVLDMGGVTFLDSAGVGGLVQLFVYRRGKSQILHVANLTAQGTAILQVAGLTKLLPTFATVEEASV
jgi:anti-anti-sigma factor